MVKGIRQNEFNRNLTSCSARFRTFPGATLKQLNHYILPTLTDDTPDVVIVHGGGGGGVTTYIHMENSYARV